MPWYAKDCHYLDDPKIIRLGDRFGAAGPLILDALAASSAAAGPYSGARIEYETLGRRCYADAETAAGVVAYAIELGLLVPLRYHGEAEAHIRCGRWVRHGSLRRHLPQWLRERIIARDGRRCGICGQSIAADDELHIDHRVPVARGGSNDEANLQPAHGRCNRRKWAAA